MNQNTSEGMTIVRRFNAPREVVFKAFTEAEPLKHWWGPVEFELHVKSLDLRPGGIFLFGMAGPDGNMMWGKFIYEEIIFPEKIVFYNCFSDENGGMGKNPWDPAWPDKIKNTWLFIDEGDHCTIHLHGIPADATPAQHQLFMDNIGNMQGGFKGTFDQLETYLATINS